MFSGEYGTVVVFEDEEGRDCPYDVINVVEVRGVSYAVMQPQDDAREAAYHRLLVEGCPECEARERAYGSEATPLIMRLEDDDELEPIEDIERAVVLAVLEGRDA